MGVRTIPYLPHDTFVSGMVGNALKNPKPTKITLIH